MEIEQQKRIKEVLESPEIVKAFKHVEVMNRELGEVRDELRENNKAHEEIQKQITCLDKNQGIMIERVDWLCKTYWIVIGAVVSSLAGVIILIIKMVL